MTIDELKELKQSGKFHHATYRNQDTLWEGLWIYVHSETGFRGFESAGRFAPHTAEIVEAERLLADTGISLGTYGRG
jgi:hypothetical protein